MGKKLVQMEAARTLKSKSEMTDSGDKTVFTLSGVTVVSGKSGYAPEVLPDGVLDTQTIGSPGSSNNVLNIAAFTAQLAGETYSVSATTVDLSSVRPETDVAKWVSIQLDSDGSTINTVEGTDSADTSYLTTRGTSAGQIPYVVDGDIELCCVLFTSSTDAVLTESQIYQTANTYQDRVYYPIVKTISNLGMGNKAPVSGKKNFYVEFNAALEAKCTGDTTKNVYVTAYSVTTFSDISRTYDFVPNTQSYGQGSRATYDGAVSFETDPTLNQGSFSAVVIDGITDQIAQAEGETMTFRFYPDEDENPYYLQQSKVGITPAYPTSGAKTVSVTLTGDAAVKFFS
jgi:hypothetical protein